MWRGIVRVIRVSQRISIIIPCLNEGAVIGPLLENLQTFRSRGHELILVDGGSQDDTLARAKPWVDQLIESEKGRARQMNAGAAGATGEILWFVHADTQLPSGSDESIVTGLTKSGRGWGRFDVSLSGNPVLLKVVAFMINWRSRLTGIATGDQGIFLYTTLFRQVGGFPEIALMEDVALSKRLKAVSRPVSLRARLLTSSRRWEQRGIIRTILLMWRLRLAYALGADPQTLATRYRECSSPAPNS